MNLGRLYFQQLNLKDSGFYLLKFFNKTKNSTNKKLLDTIIELIKDTDNMYDKIFLSKMGRSMEKYGLNTNNPKKVSKILMQLEQTENTIFNSLEKPLKIKIILINFVISMRITKKIYIIVCLIVENAINRRLIILIEYT